MPPAAVFALRLADVAHPLAVGSLVALREVIRHDSSVVRCVTLTFAHRLRGSSVCRVISSSQCFTIIVVMMVVVRSLGIYTDTLPAMCGWGS